MFNIVCFLSNLVTGASVSLADTRNHILRGIPELAGKAYILMLFICFSNVHIKINQVAEIQKPYGLKVPGKRNQYREGSTNQHFYLRGCPTERSFFPSLLMPVPFFHVTTRIKSKWAHHLHSQDITSNIGFLCQIIVLILGIMISQIQATRLSFLGVSLLF